MSENRRDEITWPRTHRRGARTSSPLCDTRTGRPLSNGSPGPSASRSRWWCRDRSAIAHAQMKLGPGVIMLGSGKHGPGTDNPWNTVKQGVYVYVEDVDAHYARAKAAGAEIVMELEDTDYGSRGYSVRDLEGHLWSFGTYRPGT